MDISAGVVVREGQVVRKGPDLVRNYKSFHIVLRKA